MNRQAEIPALTDEHADGSWYIDISGDLWCGGPWGWTYARQLPFIIGAGHGTPGVEFGPYVKLIDAEGNRVT